MPRQDTVNGRSPCWAAFLGLDRSLGICGMSFTGYPPPRRLPHICVGLALHRGTSTTLSPGTLFLHCYYYSASYLIALFCPGGVAGPPHANCYPKARAFSAASPTAWKVSRLRCV